MIVPDRPSRSADKRHAEELQRLGDRLTALPPAKLASAKVPDDLRAAIVEAHGLSRQALRRQKLLIGRLLRVLDPAEVEPIRRLVGEVLTGAQAEAELRSRLVRWRIWLIDEGDLAFEALVEACPETDQDQVRRLVDQAQVESAEQREPHASRRLDRYLRGLFASAYGGAGGDGDAAPGNHGAGDGPPVIMRAERARRATPAEAPASWRKKGRTNR